MKLKETEEEQRHSVQHRWRQDEETNVMSEEKPFTFWEWRGRASSRASRGRPCRFWLRRQSSGQLLQVWEAGRAEETCAGKKGFWDFGFTLGKNHEWIKSEAALVWGFYVSASFPQFRFGFCRHVLYWDRLLDVRFYFESVIPCALVLIWFFAPDSFKYCAFLFFK